ncbi:MAG: hypothetical protein CMH30_08880 [Micavibrio sp.]|nr:hypothetical protein [Micavibrio sp.]
MKQLFLLLAFILCSFSWPTIAKEAPIDIHGLGNIPVLHEGRIKPISELALSEFKNISGHSQLGEMDAIDWLALTLFSPAESVEIPVIKLAPSTKQKLNLDPDTSYFSLKNTLDPLLGTLEEAETLQKKKKLTKQEKSLLKAQDKVFIYNQLLRSLSLVLPLNVRTPESFAKSTYSLSYLELLKMDSELQSLAKAIGTPINQEEKDLVILAQQTRIIAKGGEDNVFFKIMPPQWQQDGDRWYSPWEQINLGTGSPESQDYLRLWQSLARAYITHNQSLWDETIEKMQPFIAPYQSRIKAEQFYTRTDPFYWSQIAYGLCLFFVLLWLGFKKEMFWRPAIFSFSIAIILHVFGLGLHMYILERAPVATLGESLIFVSLCTAIIAGFTERKAWLNHSIALGIGAFCAFGLLSTAAAIDATVGSKHVLAAVLNSNFWLGTHVIIITLGYAATLMTAFYAHYILYIQEKPNKLIGFMAISALCLMTIGTILGGIWADQSWGRFWGWDPKENGALLIILWLIWILHGRLSGHLKNKQFIAGLAASNIMLALSWFGVNLLGVGLHAYGFFEGWGLALASFCTLEIVFIGFLWRRYS